MDSEYYRTMLQTFMTMENKEWGKAGLLLGDGMFPYSLISWPGDTPWSSLTSDLTDLEFSCESTSSVKCKLLTLLSTQKI
jgi:hypothetical protein